MSDKRKERSTGNYDTEDQLHLAIASMAGDTQPVIAAATGVSVATVSRIQNPPKIDDSVPIKIDDLWIVR